MPFSPSLPFSLKEFSGFQATLGLSLPNFNFTLFNNSFKKLGGKLILLRSDMAHEHGGRKLWNRLLGFTAFQGVYMLHRAGIGIFIWRNWSNCQIEKEEKT